MEEEPVSAVERVAGSELVVAAGEGDTAPEVPGTELPGDPAVVAAPAVLGGDPVEPCGAVVVEGAGPVEEADCPESERDVVTDPWGAADAPVLELEAPVEAGDVAVGAAGVVSAEVPVPVGVAELSTGGAAEVEYSLAVEDELDGGAAVESGDALLEVDGPPVNEGVALGPRTSTWTFGDAPSGCGITMIGPTRTGPTCTGPTVTGAGSPSVVAGGVEEAAADGAVTELGVELPGGGAELELSAGGATSEREAVAGDVAAVRCDVGLSFDGAGGWIGSTVPVAVEEVRCRGCWRLVLVALEALDSGRVAGALSSSRGGGDEDDGPLPASELWGVPEDGG